MGAGHTKIKVNGLSQVKKSSARWKNRDLPTHFFGVVRHAERADSLYSLYNGGRWTASEDFQRWPVDAPLSDNGLEAAAEIGTEVFDYMSKSAVPVHVVVSSPYFRCVQTAVEICRKLQGKVRLILDRSLGELYGPDIMGDFRPVSPVRQMPEIQEYCKKYGVSVLKNVIGQWPRWPEDLRTARKRFAGRFLTYLHRSNTARRNFIVVTHADGVGAALSLMPSTLGQVIDSVNYGGYFLAERQIKPISHPSSSSASGSSGWKWAKPSKSSSRAHDTASLQRFAAVIPEVDEDFPSEEQGRDTAQESADDTFVTSVKIDPSSPSILAWIEKPDDQASSHADSPEISSSKVPKASDGWKVTTNNIKMTGKKGKAEKASKAGISSAARKMLTKRLQKLADDSDMSHEHMERLLLGSLSDKPLGSIDGKLDGLAQNGCSSALSETQTSLSTYLFGASELGSCLDLSSEPGSRMGSRVTSECFQDEDGLPAIQQIASPTEIPQRALTMQTHHEKRARTYVKRSTSKNARPMMMTVDLSPELPHSRSVTIDSIRELRTPPIFQTSGDQSPRSPSSPASPSRRHVQSARSFKKMGKIRDDSELVRPEKRSFTPQTSVSGFLTIQEMPLIPCTEDSGPSEQLAPHGTCENAAKAPAVLTSFENSTLLQRRAARINQ